MPDLPPSTLPFLIMAFLVEITPGSNMTYLALVSAADGRRAGFATVAGIALGLAVVGMLAALGVAELIQASNVLYEFLRWSGVLFLLYLAAEGWRQGTDIVAGAPVEGSRYFARGLVTNLLNPKAALFYVSVLPTFIEPSSPTTRQAIVLTGLYVLVATFVHIMIVLLAGSLERTLNAPHREKATRRILSLVLAGVAIWFAATTIR